MSLYAWVELVTTIIMRDQNVSAETKEKLGGVAYSLLEEIESGLTPRAADLLTCPQCEGKLHNGYCQNCKAAFESQAANANRWALRGAKGESMCNSVITVGSVACLVCEKDITEAIHENFYRDPVQTYKQYTCPHCQTLLDVEVIPVPYFQLSMPIGRLASVRPTQLAPDKWESPDPTGIVLPLKWDTSQDESTPPTCG